MKTNYDKNRAMTVFNFLDEKVMNNFITFFRKVYSEDMFFLMSFPRSGNGWIRYLVTEALLISKGIDLENSRRETYVHNNITAHCIITKSGQAHGIEDIFPDYYAINKDDLYDKQVNRKIIMSNGFFIKTHHLVFREDVKVVYLYRNPKDTCISYFSLNNSLNSIAGISNDFATQFKKSIKIYLDVYYKMLQFYLDKINRKASNILLFKMENIMANGIEYFRKLLEFFNIDISKEKGIEILERNPKLQTIDKNLKNKLEYYWDKELDNYATNCMELYVGMDRYEPRNQ